MWCGARRRALCRQPELRRADFVKHQIFVVEDHADLREALTRFLNEQPDLEICGAAASGAEALAALVGARAEIVIVDLSMPDFGGMELIKRLRKKDPDVRLLIFSAHDDAAYAEEALEAGALGYVSKMNPQELLVAIQQVLRNEIYLSDGMRNQLASRAAS